MRANAWPTGRRSDIAMPSMPVKPSTRTLSGRREALEAYAAAVTERHAPAAEGIDWKYGAARHDQLFNALSVRAVDEVVSLGVPAEMAPLAAAGRALSPREFHNLLQQASAASGAPAGDSVRSFKLFQM